MGRMLSKNGIRTISLSCLIVTAAGLANQNGPTTIAQVVLGKVQLAMATAKEGQVNITMAHLACDQWRDILSLEIPRNVRSLCLAFQAAALTRVGRDLESLDAYSSCLDIKDVLDTKTLQDVQLGYAYTLQRLMRYEQALQQFREISTEKAYIGAATCSLRLLDINNAIDCLKSYCEDHMTMSDANGLLGCLLLLNGEHDAAVKALHVSQRVSPLYSWALQLATNSDTVPGSFTHLEFAAVNLCALDDPLLLFVDDKVHLHELLSETREAISFWPQGYILPRELQSFQRFHSKDKREWILKERAGYGSHGNQIVSGKDIVDTSFDDVVLCQRLVNPTLLIDGRKFSIRVYVYYFLDKEAKPSTYLSSLGLVKLASMVYDEESDDERMYMTNSGREETMLQQDFVYLRSVFEKNDWSYEAFWNSTRETIKTLLSRYADFAAKEANTGYRSQLGKLGIPKILGLDFLVDDHCRPQLIEVNRFPGLEPRGDGDEIVKHKVVKEAWLCAAQRLGVPEGYVLQLFGDDLDYCGENMFSFEKIM